MRSNKKGFTSIELIVGLVIGAILVLMIGTISSIGTASFDRAMKESSTYNDLFSGLNLMKFVVRKAHTTDVALPFSGSPWSSEDDILIVDNSAFGKEDATKSLVYVKDIGSPDQKNIILANADSLSLSFNKTDSLITVSISGAKGRESFNIPYYYIMKRN